MSAKQLGENGRNFGPIRVECRGEIMGQMVEESDPEGKMPIIYIYIYIYVYIHIYIYIYMWVETARAGTIST